MALQLPFGIDVLVNEPLDKKYGPWASLAAAKAGIPLALRYDGLSVRITGLGEYNWLAADLTDTGLVPKSAGGGGTSNKLQKYFTVADGITNIYTVVGYTVGEIFLVLVGSVPQVETSNYNVSGNSIDFTPSTEIPSVGLQILILFYETPISVGTWLIAGGLWNDAGVWIDSSFWID